MAITWCRAAAKLRILSSSQKTQCCLFAPCEIRSHKEIGQTQTRGKTQYVQQATNSVKKVKYLQELYRRRLKAGPEPERHPSKFGCWNIEAERYAFGKRIGEEFDDQSLRLALRCSSLRVAEEERNVELGISIQTVVGDNTELAEQGREVAKKYIEAYLRYSFPELFEEGIRAVSDHLLSDDTLLFLGKNFGLKDLIESNVYPPVDSEYITTFLAVIGALLYSQGKERVKFFVMDFIVPQLVGKDISELWMVANPIGVVAGILEKAGRGPPEPRLLYSSGKNTLMSLFTVGIYSDEKLIGKSPGETEIIAEEMAARDALKNLMNLQDSRPPLILGDRARDIQLDLDKVNLSVTEVLKLDSNQAKIYLTSG